MIFLPLHDLDALSNSSFANTLNCEGISVTPISGPLVTRKSARVKTIPIKLRDYNCNNVWTTTHSPFTLSNSTAPLGKAFYPLTHFVNYDKFSSSHRYFLASTIAKFEPTQYSEAVSHPKWRSAMKQTIDTLEKNSTWTLTALSLGKRAL